MDEKFHTGKVLSHIWSGQGIVVHPKIPMVDILPNGGSNALVKPVWSFFFASGKKKYGRSSPLKFPWSTFYQQVFLPSAVSIKILSTGFPPPIKISTGEILIGKADRDLLQAEFQPGGILIGNTSCIST